MNDLQQLLATRDSRDATRILGALREGLSPDPDDSGVASSLHRLLQGFFAIEDVAFNSSHKRAFKRHPQAAEGLVAMVEEDGETAVAQLMRSILEGKPRPLGAMKQGLEQARGHAAQGGQGVLAALNGFASVALRSADTTAELELSLGWQVVEQGLLDRVALHAEHLAFAHGESHRKALSREAALNGLVAREDIATMLRKLSQARDARVLARAGEWAIENEGAPADTVEVPVRHQPRKATLGPATRLDEGEVAAQVGALYEFSNGGSLFVPTQHQPMEPGLELIPDGLWEAQREHVMTWVSMGMAEDEVPAWARSVIPFAALPGDAGRWVVVTEGPHAGAVMMAAGDIHEEHVRYRSLAHFIAALRLFPQEILGCGGYVRYTAPGSELALFPEGYREDE